MDVHIDREYGSNTLESCRYVQVPSSGDYAMAFLCGADGADSCTTDTLYQFLGHNSFAPFAIDYKIHDENNTFPGYTPPKMKTIPCSEAVDVSATERMAKAKLSG